MKRSWNRKSIGYGGFLFGIALLFYCLATVPGTRAQDQEEEVDLGGEAALEEEAPPGKKAPRPAGAYQGPPPAPVETGPVLRAEIAPRSPVLGTVISRQDAELAMEIKGRLRFIVEVGTRLEAGAPVARLEEKVYRLEVQAAEAELRGTQSMLDFYGREVGRIQRLAEANNAALNKLDQVKNERDQASSRLQSARARLDLARDRLSKTTLYAPFAGVVAERFQSIGAFVKEQGKLLRLVDLAGLEISARISAAAAAFLREGMEITVQGLDKDRPLQQRGRLRAVVEVGDRSRLYELRLVLEQSPWRVGEAVRLLVPQSAPRSVLLVPRDALVVRSQGMLVYKLDGQGGVVAVPVEVGDVEVDHLEVEGELAVGDQVVTLGSERLYPGRRIRIRPGVSGDGGEAEKGKRTDPAGGDRGAEAP